MTLSTFTLSSVATVTGCYPDKFGVPRQPGLAPSATARIRLLPPYDDPNAVRGLKEFSHIWLTFIFHHSPQAWHPLVRPPRLGGNAKIGVFASRATHRPNRIGLSLVELVDIVTHPTVELIVRGHDLVNDTPVIDIKPYLPWADSVDNASAGFAPAAPVLYPVSFSAEANTFLKQRDDEDELRALIVDIIAQDPRPAYHVNIDRRRYGVRLKDIEVGFCVDAGMATTGFLVKDISPTDTN